MKKSSFVMVSICLALTLAMVPRFANAHCEVPCGIYDDNARVVSMLEDVTTIKKAIKLMNELAGKTDVQSQQQFVRWVNTKEMHAQKIISTISNYFLTQRIKASQEDYVERLKKHHAVIVWSMKSKQKADPKVAMDLEAAVQALLPYYPEHH